MTLRQQFKKETGFDVDVDGPLNHAIYWFYINWLEAKINGTILIVHTNRIDYETIQTA